MSFNPDREVQLFRAQARKGQKLTGISLDANGWMFEKAPAEEAEFDIAYQDDPTDEYFGQYAIAGWEHVVSHGRIHVFRAPIGTVPVPQAYESRITEITTQRNRFLKFAGIALVALVAVFILISYTDIHDALEAALVALVAFPTIYVTVPALGYTRQLIALKRQR